MTRAAIYDTATGTILQITEGELVAIVAALSPGQGAIEAPGNVSDTSHRVVNGNLVPLPPKGPNLAEAKAKAKARIASARARADAAGVTVGSNTVATDLPSLVRLALKVVASNAPQDAAVAKAVAAQLVANENRYQARVQAIDNATDVTVVNATDW